MRKISKKLKSSALLIAMVIGVVVSATLFGLVAATNQYIKIAGQSRDGKIAYQAALSGIEDGLLRYRYASAQGKTNLVVRRFDEQTRGVFDQFKIDDLTSAYYNLSIRSDSISYGNYPDLADWYNDATKATQEKALPLLSDDTMEIDLDYAIRKNDATSLSIDVIFSNPFEKNDINYAPVSGFYSAVNYQLINYSAKGEEQIVSESINNDSSRHILTISSLAQCQVSTAQCRLRITPRVVKSTFGVSSSNRFNGSRTTSVLDQKYVFFKIIARNNGEIIPSEDYKPGVLVIESIGVSGDAKRKLQVQLDFSTGKYLGMFDFGVYCGDKCIMPYGYDK